MIIHFVWPRKCWLTLQQDDQSESYIVSHEEIKEVPLGNLSTKRPTVPVEPFKLIKGAELLDTDLSVMWNSILFTWVRPALVSDSLFEVYITLCYSTLTQAHNNSHAYYIECQWLPGCISVTESAAAGKAAAVREERLWKGSRGRRAWHKMWIKCYPKRKSAAQVTNWSMCKLKMMNLQHWRIYLWI